MSLYGEASFKVRTSSGHANKLPVSARVLKGEILSPLLFALFVHDFEEFFRSRNVRGLSINHREDVLLLMYADDTAILSYSEGDTKRKLGILHEYCSSNKLTVNVSKTKIMVKKPKNLLPGQELQM